LVQVDLFFRKVKNEGSREEKGGRKEEEGGVKSTNLSSRRITSEWPS
jgi:hypothetical protein